MVAELESGVDVAGICLHVFRYDEAVDGHCVRVVLLVGDVIAAAARDVGELDNDTVPQR